MDHRPHLARRIVVGVDGSPPSKQALRWAIEQAAVTGAVVDAVICWLHPIGYGRAPMTADPRPGRAAEKILAETVDEVAGQHPAVEIQRLALLGNTGEILVERSQGAELLVVGNRGHGGFTGALLGSVSQHCIRHAPCPVVVVRAD